MRYVYIVCYDIADDKRLRNVYKIMRGFGERLQYSVFMCELSDKERVVLEDKLLDVINQDEDQVLFIPLGKRDSRYVQGIYSLGIKYSREERTCFVF